METLHSEGWYKVTFKVEGIEDSVYVLALSRYGAYLIARQMIPAEAKVRTVGAYIAPAC